MGVPGLPACLQGGLQLDDSTSLVSCPVRELGKRGVENTSTCFCFLSCRCRCRPFLPHCAGSVSGTFSADSVEEEVFENERFARGRQGSQWSPANLLPGQDPRRYMYALQQADAFPQVGACAACTACTCGSCGGVGCQTYGQS